MQSIISRVSTNKHIFSNQCKLLKFIIRGMLFPTKLTSLINTLELIDSASLENHHNTLRWRHNGCDSVSNHQPHECLLNCLFRRRSKKTSKPRVTGLCVGNSPGTGEFPAQMASNAENVSIWWRHHERRNSGNHKWPKTFFGRCISVLRKGQQLFGPWFEGN